MPKATKPPAEPLHMAANFGPAERGCVEELMRVMEDEFGRIVSVNKSFVLRTCVLFTYWCFQKGLSARGKPMLRLPEQTERTLRKLFRGTPALEDQEANAVSVSHPA